MRAKVTIAVLSVAAGLHLMICQGALAKPERGFRVGLIAGTAGPASFAGEAVQRAVQSTDRDKERL
jgi:hypothetical protein